MKRIFFAGPMTGYPELAAWHIDTGPNGWQEVTTDPNRANLARAVGYKVTDHDTGRVGASAQSAAAGKVV